jgi:6-phosphofructokinase 1
VDASEAREVGEKAVQFSVWHNVDGSVAIKRVGDYAVEYELLNLEQVAAKTKHMPDEYLSGDNMVTEAFKNYCRPLLGGIPSMDRISAPSVHKVMGP